MSDDPGLVELAQWADVGALARWLPGSIDHAWAAVEAALPDGWFMGGLTNTAYRGTPERWMAQVYEGPEDDANYRRFQAAHAATPAAALLALVEKLAQR